MCWLIGTIGWCRLYSLHGWELCMPWLQDAWGGCHCHPVPHCGFINNWYAAAWNGLAIASIAPASWAIASCYARILLAITSDRPASCMSSLILRYIYAEKMQENGMDVVTSTTSQVTPAVLAAVDEDSLDRLPLMRTSVIIAMVMLLKAHLKSLYSLSEMCVTFASSSDITYSQQENQQGGSSQKDCRRR